MDHPFLSNKNIYYYTGVWLAISAAHASVLYYLFGLPLKLATTDALVFNLIFAGFGLSYWFTIRFSSLQRSSALIIMLNHLVGGVVVVGLGVVIANFVLKGYLGEQSSELLVGTPWKVFAGMFYYSVIVLVYYLIKYYSDLQQKANAEVRLESEIKQAELNMLKFQINPHFIFNSLNSISALTISRPDAARDMLIKLSDFLRYSLGDENKSKTTLKDELENISLYLDIEKVRFGDKLDLQKNLDEGSLEWRIPNMIFQPIIENAIKYGVHESMGKVTIVIDAEILNDNLEIKFTNNFDPDMVPVKGKGIGLKNVGHRLSLIYGSDELLRTEKGKDTFVVCLTVPPWPEK